MDKCSIDLSRHDLYDDEIPDSDIELTLKVIRSIRNQSLGPDWFDADAAVVLSHAHATIVRLVEEVQRVECLEEVAELHACW